MNEQEKKAEDARQLQKMFRELERVRTQKLMRISVNWANKVQADRFRRSLDALLDAQTEIELMAKSWC